MGVTGLWRLIEPSGKPVPLETLENKVLAIDVSIWLHQAIKGFQDSQGAPLPNAHLLGIYHRVCKLLYFRIKPVFVFDGGVPYLKKETIIKRQQQRSKKLTEAEQIQKQLLTTLLKHAAVKNVLSEKTKATLTSPKTSPTKTKETDNIYKLPPTDFSSSITSSDEESSASDFSPTKSWDLHTIDEKSKHFKSLPADVRHDILTELKETRKQSSWGRIHEMPKKSDDFSGFQMKRLLKRYSVQASLEEAAKEMGGHSLSLAELEALLKDQGVVTSSSGGSRIASDENARYLLIKDVKKAMDEAKLQEGKESNPETDVEYKKNLETAIQLSLQDVPGTSKSEPKDAFLNNFHDADFQSSSENSDNEEVANSDQNLVPAKSYMIEYSGLTPAEIDKIIGKNIASKSRKHSPRTSVNFVPPDIADIDKAESKADDSDSSDGEFLDVMETPALNNCKKNLETHFEILINPKESIPDDDLFSDIFSDTKLSDSRVTDDASNFRKNSEALSNEQQKTVEHMMNKEVCLEPIKTVDPKPGDIITNGVASTEPIETVNQKPVGTVTNEAIANYNAELQSDTTLQVSTLESDSKESKDTAANEKPSSENLLVNPSQVNRSLASQEIGSNNKLHIIDSTERNGKSTEINSQIENKLQSEIFVDKHMDEVELMDSTKEQRTNDIETLKDKTLNSSHLTTNDLQEMAINLRNEKIDLEAERLSKERSANNLTDQIYQEAQELLQLFGVPYIVAPMEAEAQCAFLNSINLTQGTITDDSDIWLFGGQTVYKNFFNQRKHVLEYRFENIQHNFKLSREQMILLALLVGSDYTTGLQGVGPVTALEILAKFPPIDDLTSGLIAFRKWLSTDKASRNITLRNKLKNVSFTEGFPSTQVVKAYLEPAVDTSEEAFSWSAPDVNGLLEFARQKFGWHRIKSEEILKPVLKRLNENVIQRSIKDFFKTKHKIDGGDAEAKMSKRVKKAVEAIGRGEGNNDSEENVVVKPRTNKNQRSTKGSGEDQAGTEQAQPRTRKNRKNTEDSDLQVLRKTIIESRKKVKGIKTKIEKQIKTPSAPPDLHKKEIIPQKERDKVDALRGKLKAIEVLRKSKMGPGYVKKRKQAVRNVKVDAELSESSSD